MDINEEWNLEPSPEELRRIGTLPLYESQLPPYQESFSEKNLSIIIKQKLINSKCFNIDIFFFWLGTGICEKFNKEFDDSFLADLSEKFLNEWFNCWSCQDKEKLTTSLKNLTKKLNLESERIEQLKKKILITIFLKPYVFRSMKEILEEEKGYWSREERSSISVPEVQKVKLIEFSNYFDHNWRNIFFSLENGRVISKVLSFCEISVTEDHLLRFRF